MIKIVEFSIPVLQHLIGPVREQSVQGFVWSSDVDQTASFSYSQHLECCPPDYPEKGETGSHRQDCRNGVGRTDLSAHYESPTTACGPESFLHLSRHVGSFRDQMAYDTLSIPSNSDFFEPLPKISLQSGASFS